MDLAKVGEVYSWKSTPEGGPPIGMAEQLANGWVLLSVKIVEEHGYYASRPYTTPYVVYVLGKPRSVEERQRQSAARQKEDEQWRRENLPTTDPQHPDFPYEGRNEPPGQ